MRTNNLAENTNRKLSHLLGKHPQFYEWLLGIQKMAALTQCRWIQLQKYDKTRLRKPNERKKNDTLNELIKGYYVNEDKLTQSCPKNITIPCMCWMAMNRYDTYMGPYCELNMNTSISV